MPREETEKRLREAEERGDVQGEIRKMLQEEDEMRAAGLPWWAFWGRMEILHPVLTTIIFLIPFAGLGVMLVIDIIKTIWG